MAKYIMSPEQRSYLRAIVNQGRKLQRQTLAVGQTKAQLDEMIATGREMGISNTRIAKALNLTEARISQIKKERHDAASAAS